jgi:hypothetical protein
MPIATLREAVTTMSAPPYSIVRWSCPTDSTGLIEISIPAVYHTESSYKADPKTINTARSYAIRLSVFAIGCDSTSFDIQIITKDDEDAADTIYEVLKYTDINKSHIDQSFSEFVIKNCDTPMVNKLYIIFTNNDSESAGTLDIQLTYMTMQDRPFANIVSN